MSVTGEQRNPYKGVPPRAWLRVELLGPDGSSKKVDLLADTGSPCAVIVGASRLDLMNLIPGLGVATNFGPMVGGHLRVRIPEVGFDEYLMAYSSDKVVQTTQASSPDFEGLIGLPALRMLNYGGDASSFWVQPAAGGP